MLTILVNEETKGLSKLLILGLKDISTPDCDDEIVVKTLAGFIVVCIIIIFPAPNTVAGLILFIVDASEAGTISVDGFDGFLVGRKSPAIGANGRPIFCSELSIVFVSIPVEFADGFVEVVIVVKLAILAVVTGDFVVLELNISPTNAIIGIMFPILIQDAGTALGGGVVVFLFFFLHLTVVILIVQLVFIKFQIVYLRLFPAAFVGHFSNLWK